MEADSTASLAHLRALAEAAFADAERADRWLHRRSRQLGGRTPIEVACTEDAAQRVERLLARLTWGAAF